MSGVRAPSTILPILIKEFSSAGWRKITTKPRVSVWCTTGSAVISVDFTFNFLNSRAGFCFHELVFFFIALYCKKMKQFFPHITCKFRGSFASQIVMWNLLLQKSACEYLLWCKIAAIYSQKNNTLALRVQFNSGLFINLPNHNGNYVSVLYTVWKRPYSIQHKRASSSLWWEGKTPF